MKKILLFLLLSGFGFFCEAKDTGVLTFPDKDILTTNDDIWIGVALYQTPCLDYSPPRTDFFYHLSNDNHITYVFPALAYTPCINVPNIVRVHNAGKLPEGDYTLQIYLVNHASQLPTSLSDPLGTTVGNLIQFTVYAPAASVPAIGFWGISLMIIAVLLSLFLLRKRPIFNRGER